MNKTAIIVLAISSLMMMSGSLAFAQGSDSGNSSQVMVKMSAYTVGSYNSFGTLTNVSYTSDSTNNQTEIASAIYVNGSSMGNIPTSTENEKVTFLSISNETLIGM
ncbi:MAG: hypothetical protein ACYDDC_09050, partial [Thermoplasmataceae archaeon]